MEGEGQVFFLPVPKEISQYLCSVELDFFNLSADKTDYEASQPGCAIWNTDVEVNILK